MKTEPRKAKVSIIIPICNVDYPLAHYTGNCIGSVKHFTNKEIDYEIIVIDNGSTITLSGLDWEKEVDIYIKNENNLGVPKAWNQGIKAANGDVLVFLNSDTEVYESRLLCLLEDLKWVGAVNTHPMYDCPFGRAEEAAKRYEKLKDSPPPKFLSEFRDGSCFATTKEVIENIGIFDENFGIGYGEDDDFIRRLEEKGYKVKCDERVAIHHIGMATGFSLMNQNLIDMNKTMDDNREYYKNKVEGKKPIAKEEKPRPVKIEIKEKPTKEIHPILGYKIES